MASDRTRHIPISDAEWHPLQTLRRQIGHALDTMYDKIGKHHHAVSGQVFAGFSPDTDLGESESGFRVGMELPGLNEDDIEILISDEFLLVSGEKRADREVSEQDYRLRERAYGSFRRSFWLPPDLDTEKAQAQYWNGILTVDVPRRPGSRQTARKIPIKSR